MGDEAEPAPLEVGAKLEHVGHHLERAQVALPRDDALVLVLDVAAAAGELAEDHLDRLEDVERLEPGDHDRLAVVGRDELERARAHDRRDVARANEPVEPQIGRFEQRPSGGTIVTWLHMHREVLDAPRRAPASASAPSRARSSRTRSRRTRPRDQGSAWRSAVRRAASRPSGCRRRRPSRRAGCRRIPGRASCRRSR